MRLQEYKVKVLSSQGQIVERDFQAIDEIQLRLLVKQSGCEFISCQRTIAQRFAVGQTGRKAKFDLLRFCVELSALIHAGLSIIEAIEALSEKEQDQQLRAVFQKISEHLYAGLRFSEALGLFPEQFDAVFVGVITAAERTSGLYESLRRYITYLQKIDVVKNKLISSMVYPIVLLFVSTLVTLFLVMYVVPRFADVYQGTGRDLPWVSAYLLALGKLISHHKTEVLLTIGSAVWVLFWYLRRLFRSGKLLLVVQKNALIKTPLQIFMLSRLYMTLAMLLNGGIPLPLAMQRCRTVVDLALFEKINVAAEQISSGQSISDAFANQGLATSISLRFIRVGERTGKLAEMLFNAADFYEEELKKSIDIFIKAFEPILMSIIGLIIGLVVVALYLPIFSLADGLR